jgi:Flp pilus assembly protein TadD
MKILSPAVIAAVLALAACAQTPPSQPQPIGADTMNVADAAIAGGDPNMALSVTQSALKSDPNNVDDLIHEGDAYYALSRCPSAQAAYQLALTHDPRSSAAETGLGRCLLKTDPHEADAAFTAAVQDDPGNAAAFNDLGIARDLEGDFAGAVDPYRKALVANPGLTAAEVNLGLSLALSGHGPEALQYLGPLATSQNATPKIREDYAAALVASGRDDEARQVLSVDLPPDQATAALNGFAAVIAQSQGVAPPPPPPPTQPVVQTAPVVATPTAPAAPPAAPPAPPARPAAAAAPAASDGGTAIQLGALASADDANRLWAHLSASDPSLFSDKSPDVETAVVKGATYYRLRVNGFGSKAAAGRFCGQVLAAGHACTVANF